MTREGSFQMETENTYTYIIDEAYGFKSLYHIQTRDGLIFSANQNNYILKQIPDSEERSYFTYAVQYHLYNNGFQNTDRIIKKQDGGILCEINGKKYVCRRLIKARQCMIENTYDCRQASALLAFMHNSAKGFTASLAEKIVDEVSICDETYGYIRSELGHLPSLLEHRTDELLRFKKQAQRYNGRFDYEYASVADDFYVKACEICAALEKSGYSKLTEKYEKEGCICHREYTSHNILLSNDRVSIAGSAVINFDCSTIDMPVFDLANLLKRRMRKCGWNAEDAHAIIDEYNRIRPLSDTEIEIIKIALSFPQKLWRVVNIYYNSRRSWCEKSCLLKLEEIKKEQEEIKKFIKTF